jgi:hypothetical protein
VAAVVNVEDPTPATAAESPVTGGSLIDEIVRTGACFEHGRLVEHPQPQAAA